MRRIPFRLKNVWERVVRPELPCPKIEASRRTEVRRVHAAR
jgi:hypothetical protein